MARFDWNEGSDGTALGVAAPLGETLFAMGLRLAAGREGNVDLVAAHMYFNLADRFAVEDAAFHRAQVSGAMSKSEIARALRDARAWLATH